MGDTEVKGNKLSVVQRIEKGVLAGPFQTEFEIENGIVVSISQELKRKIDITSGFPMSSNKFMSIFQNIEMLFMLFDGRFYNIEELTISNNGAESVDILGKYNEKRLNCFVSNNLYQHTLLKLIFFQDILTTDLYKEWIALIDDLDIAFKMFLYALSDNKMTADLNFAFLVELAEPFTELVKERTYYCQTLNPGERGTTLKMCVDNLIVLYGTDIFAKELKDNYTLFLDRVVKSRVRIMHIKKNQKNYFEGKECVKYSLKFSLLYRIILLSLLGIPYQQYQEKIHSIVKKIDEWEMTEVS